MEDSIKPDAFWRSIYLLLTNFNAVNKTIFACQVRALQIIESDKDIVGGSMLLTNHASAGQAAIENNAEELLHAILNDTTTNSTSHTPGKTWKLSLLLLPKTDHLDIEAICLIDTQQHLVKMHFLQIVHLDDFSVQLLNSKLEIKVLTQRLPAEKSERWCNFVLHPKLLKWCEPPMTTKGVRSLQLLDVHAYNELYKQLKRKHAAPLRELWQCAKESTDPLKFIYEDLAIAAYLICLWRRPDCAAPIAFADLGCGNGLLAHILASEGYRGFGIDLRTRKLWCLYPKCSTLQLLEQAIDPQNFQLPKEVDWLIGNHSDELSPWLPVLAARTSAKARLFLLPCCAYEFSGCKFQRRNSSMSVYADFMDYARNITETCGFRVLQDRLKIPSTKRLALVGVPNCKSATVYAEQLKTIDQFVQQQIAAHANTGPVEVQLREREEITRNCTRINADIIDGLVLKIFRMILKQQTMTAKAELQSGDPWEAGGQLSLQAIAVRLNNEDLQHIKNECGGIKTLLRNKHEIFEFHKPSQTVGIRRPQPADIKKLQANPRLTIKKRACFFQKHHPQACPLKEETCTFIHAD